MEITADAVKSFVSDVEDDGDSDVLLPEFLREAEEKFMWRKLAMNVGQISSAGRGDDEEDHVPDGNAGMAPRINGKHNKGVQTASLRINGRAAIQGNSIMGMMYANIAMYKEVLPGLESWKSSKVASWHSLESHPIQWFCVVCIDRRGWLSHLNLFLPRW